MQTIAAVVSAVITLIAVGLSWRVYTYQRTQAHFALALSLHEKLTTGEVATARDVLHTLQYGDETVKGAVRVREAVVAYYTLLWAFERVYAGSVSIREHSRRLRRDRSASTTPALRFLYSMVHWHVREWNGYLPNIRLILQDRLGRAPDDALSVGALVALVASLEAAGYPCSTPLSK